MSEKADMGPPPGYDATQAPLQPGQPTPAWQQPQQGPTVAQPASTTVVVQHQQPMPATAPQPVIIQQRMQPFPMNMQCPNCRNTVTTITVKETGIAVWASCCAMVFFGLWLGCCLIPFCVDGLKDTVHTCPICKFTIGKHSIIS